jgi:hypothetical protein
MMKTAWLSVLAVSADAMLQTSFCFEIETAACNEYALETFYSQPFNSTALDSRLNYSVELYDDIVIKKKKKTES